ncbi:MAG TPA: sulfite exporter TauE/SafE family protein [Alphaproteobacteria bacterium]|nr:sulfite exporter TauE/SafE family protein [Alphaproteobacteria bacterium]
MIETFVSSLYSLCDGGAWVAEVGRALGGLGLPGVLFAAGLAGGFSHCIGMCGPFVLAQITADANRSTSYGELRRLRGALLLPYHFGRLTTYAALGALAGSTTGLAARLTGFHWLLAGFLLLAAFLFLAQAMSAITPWLPALRSQPLGGAFSGPLVRMARPLLVNPRGPRGYMLGLALGCLPCGFLYGAVAAAAAGGSATRGALAMIAFGVGTAVDLMLVGYAGVFFSRRLPVAARVFSMPLMLMNAGLLGLLAIRAFA